MLSCGVHSGKWRPAFRCSVGRCVRITWASIAPNYLLRANDLIFSRAEVVFRSLALLNLRDDLAAHVAHGRRLHRHAVVADDQHGFDFGHQLEPPHCGR